MTGDATVTGTGELLWPDAGDDASEVLGLAIAWSLDEPHRVGEIALFGAQERPSVLGRPGGDDVDRCVIFGRHTPGRVEHVGPPRGSRISRRQLIVTPSATRLEVDNVGRCPLLVNGREMKRAEVGPGDTLELRNQLLLVVVERSRRLPRLTAFDGAGHAFGRADRFGLVGESPALWRLRDELAFVAPRQPHVLLLGPSGSGKELAARALHAMSARRDRPWVSRNAATLPAGLVDAELFGNVRDYPNPGMAERPGLVGAAHRGTLFLDEVGELPEALQAHLLRVLDGGGEYTRLGESRTRRADLRLIAATNRGPDELKHDLLARIDLRVTLPDLNARREDIPLLVRHLLGELAATDPAVGERFFAGWDGRRGEPRVEPALIEALVRHRYTHHVRELRTHLWRAMSASRGTFLALGDEVRAALVVEDGGPTDPASLTPAQVQAALDEHGGNQAATWKALGLSSRDVLFRLIKKHGLVVRR